MIPIQKGIHSSIISNIKNGICCACPNIRKLLNKYDTYATTKKWCLWKVYSNMAVVKQHGKSRIQNYKRNVLTNIFKNPNA